MEQVTRTATAGLFEALRAEVEGYHFYLMAARSTRDDRGRRMFELLASEELEHERFLKGQYHALVDSGRLDSALTLGQPATLSAENPIFSDALRERVGEAHYEMSALSIGIQLEQASIARYRALLGQATDPQVKQFFEQLVGWEEGHHQALTRQQEQLKESYWNAAGFTPF